MAAPADLEPPRLGFGFGFGFGLEFGLGLRLGLGLGSGWSGPTFKVEIAIIRPAQSLFRPLLHITKAHFIPKNCFSENMQALNPDDQPHGLRANGGCNGCATQLGYNGWLALPLRSSSDK